MSRRVTTPPPIACLAYTAARGWHLATVTVEQIVAAELEDYTPTSAAPGPARPVEVVELEPCGSRSAAVRHRRRGEPVDAACAAAEREWNAARARRTRAAARARRAAEQACA